ncbi:MAG: hypothetical protein AAF907_17605 [Planctomycetota bacterium]
MSTARITMNMQRAAQRQRSRIRQSIQSDRVQQRPPTSRQKVRDFALRHGLGHDPEADRYDVGQSAEARAQGGGSRSMTTTDRTGHGKRPRPSGDTGSQRFADHSDALFDGLV